MQTTLNTPLLPQQDQLQVRAVQTIQSPPGLPIQVPHQCGSQALQTAPTLVSHPTQVLDRTSVAPLDLRMRPVTPQKMVSQTTVTETH
ncbi:MAG: hypothetical protein AB2693_22605, partial [Candidatus Thiodiazotropha sp.]